MTDNDRLDKFCGELNLLDVFNRAYPMDVPRYEFFRDKLREVFADIRREENEECARIADLPKKYFHILPCPDGMAGCLVAHGVEWKRQKDSKEIAEAIRERINLSTPVDKAVNK